MKKLVTVMGLVALSSLSAVKAQTTGEMRRDHIERVARVQKLARALLSRIENEAFSMRPDILASVETSLYGVNDALNGRRPRPTPTPTRPREYTCEQNPNLSLSDQSKAKMSKLASETLGYPYFEARDFVSDWAKNYTCESSYMYISNAEKLDTVGGTFLQLPHFQALSYVRENATKLCSDYDLVGKAMDYSKLADRRNMSYFDKIDFIKTNLIKDGAYSCLINKL